MSHGSAVYLHIPGLAHAKVGTYIGRIGENTLLVATEDGFELEVSPRWVEEVKDEPSVLLVIIMATISAAILFGISWWMLG